MLVHAMHRPHPAMHRPHPAMQSLVCVSKVTWIGIRLARPPVTLLISFHQLSNAKRRGSPASSSGHQADWRLGLQQAGHIESQHRCRLLHVPHSSRATLTCGEGIPASASHKQHVCPLHAITCVSATTCACACSSYSPSTASIQFMLLRRLFIALVVGG